MDILPNFAWLFPSKCLMRGLRRIVRVAPSVLVIGWLPTLLSCATPVVFGPDHFGIGIYTVDWRMVNSNVSYRHIEGVGAIVIDRRLSLGYIDHQSVCAGVDGRSYTARTPLVTFAVGQEAVKAGTEYVFPDSLGLERSE
jgi:hypothetical protein